MNAALLSAASRGALRSGPLTYKSSVFKTIHASSLCSLRPMTHHASFLAPALFGPSKISGKSGHFSLLASVSTISKTCKKKTLGITNSWKGNNVIPSLSFQRSVGRNCNR